VLLAEDDPAFRHLLASALREDGFEVIEASTGEELGALIASQILGFTEASPIDLIISDVRMPRTSGLEVVVCLRDLDWATPIILMTAFGDDTLRSEARRLGVGAVFDKPFDLENLRTAALLFTGR
jgi:DNA-binding response OmpR family regulator